MIIGKLSAISLCATRTLREQLSAYAPLPKATLWEWLMAPQAA
ncbi:MULTISPECIES: hypothetical protein [Moorena]|nr:MULTISPECIES: hypothetical protein [Moorena]